MLKNKSTQFFCPFCKNTASNKGNIFLSWQGVSSHAKLCSNKITPNPYIFDKGAGIIFVEDFTKNYSSNYIRYLYPSLSKTIAQIRSQYKQRGFIVDLENPQGWKKEELIEILKQFYVENSRIPEIKDLDKESYLPKDGTYRLFFSSWKEALIAANLQYSSDFFWEEKEIIDSIIQFYNIHNRIPFCKEFSNNIKYPSYATVSKRFGSWNRAIEVAGFKANYDSQFGTPTTAKDGVRYKSSIEAYFVDNYLYNKYHFDYEPRYKDKLWRYDFYVKELDLYIEIDGELRPDRINEKIHFNKENNIKCLVLLKKDIYKKDFKLECL